MRLLFSDVLVTDENNENHAKRVNIAVGGNTVEYVGEARPDGEFDRVISGNYLVIPGFYNAHCHSAMTLFRGLGGKYRFVKPELPRKIVLRRSL